MLPQRSIALMAGWWLPAKSGKLNSSISLFIKGLGSNRCRPWPQGNQPRRTGVTQTAEKPNRHTKPELIQGQDQLPSWKP
jgi:hypothetical protein